MVSLYQTVKILREDSTQTVGALLERKIIGEVQDAGLILLH